MYDIKIFLEKDWKFWARVNAWKEIVYWLWNTQKELMNDIKEGLSISLDNNKSEKVTRLYNFLDNDNEKLLCH